MIDEPCTCTHGDPPCIHCYATQRLAEKNELIEAMAELTNHEFENLVKIITSADDHMLPSPDQSRLNDHSVNSCDPHGSRTKEPPDKTAIPIRPQIFSEASSSVFDKTQKSSVAMAIDTRNYRDTSSNTPMTNISQSCLVLPLNSTREMSTLQKDTTLGYFQQTNSDFDLVDLGPATLGISPDLSESSCGMCMSPCYPLHLIPRRLESVKHKKV